MSISVRYFIVLDETINKISQNKFNGFCFRKEPGLPEYSGQVIKMAEVYVETINRKVTRIIRIDCVKYKADNHGALSKEYEEDSRNHMTNLISPPQVETASGVLNASEIFNAKRLKFKLTWEITEEIRAEISNILKI